MIILADFGRFGIYFQGAKDGMTFALRVPVEGVTGPGSGLEDSCGGIPFCMLVGYQLDCHRRSLGVFQLLLQVAPSGSGYGAQDVTI